jgi:hypothetical protein
MYLIEKHNKEADSGQHTYWLAMNRFGDKTNKEMRKLNGFAKPILFTTSDNLYYQSSNRAIPASVGKNFEYLQLKFTRSLPAKFYYAFQIGEKKEQ